MAININVARYRANSAREFLLAELAVREGNALLADRHVALGSAWLVLLQDGEDVISLLMPPDLPLADGHAETVSALWEADRAAWEALADRLADRFDIAPDGELTALRNEAVTARNALRDALGARCYVLDSRWQDCGLRYADIGDMEEAVKAFCDLDETAPDYPEDGLLPDRDYHVMYGVPNI